MAATAQSEIAVIGIDIVRTRSTSLGSSSRGILWNGVFTKLEYLILKSSFPNPQKRLNFPSQFLT